MSEKDDKTLEGLLGALCLMIMLPVLLAFNAMYDAFVARCLWRWFIVPEFGVNELSWAAAIGISLLIAHWSHQHKVESERSKKDNALTGLSSLIVCPTMILAVGWVTHLLTSGN